MKSSNLYMLLIVLFFAACEQEEIGVSPLTDDTNLQSLLVRTDMDKEDDDKTADKDKDCFELVYPLSITMPDGSELSGEEDALWEAVKSWYDANPTSKGFPKLNYPVDLLWDGVDTKPVHNAEEMELVKKYCSEEKETEKVACVSLVYPVTWSMPDGSAITMKHEDDWEAIKTWYDANPDSEDKPELSYPVDVLLDDGTSKTLSAESEMEALKKDC